MSTAPPPPPSRRLLNGTVERLYVFWIVSSLLLVLLVIVVTLFGTGQLRRHAQRISEQSQAIDELREEVALSRQELKELRATLWSAAPRFEAPAAPPDLPPGPMQPSEDEPLEPEPEPAAATVPPGDGGIDALLQTALRESEELPYELADPVAARDALRLGLRDAGNTIWSGQTWARLAVVARLLDRDVPAEMFALRAEAAREPPLAYYEISARKLLEQRQTAEALVFARRLAQARPGDPRGALLLAEAYHLIGDLTAAHAALEKLARAEHLSPPDKLRLGRLFVTLERWDRLDALLSSLDQVPPPAAPALNYLRAVLAIQQDRLPEALAILDNLLVDQPDDYELRTWRGVALLYARQFQAAREALALAQEQADRPEAWYWRGMLELRAGNPDEAIPFLQHALAASLRFAPAWEALGTIALNQSDLATALQNLSNAASYSPRRASVHFLLAIVHAKASRPNQMAAALRTAFRLDPTLVETARQTEVISRLLSPDELDALAGVDVPQSQPTPGPDAP